MKTDGLNKLISDSELWELFHKLGDYCTLTVHSELETSEIVIEVRKQNLTVFSVSIQKDPDENSYGIIYSFKYLTNNGKLYESNTDTIDGRRLKRSLKEIIEFGGRY